MKRIGMLNRSGLASVVGGTLLIASGTLAFTFEPDAWTPLGKLLSGIWPAALMLLVVGAVGLYLRQARRMGLSGAAGMAITCTGLAMGFVGIISIFWGLTSTDGTLSNLLWTSFELGHVIVVPLGTLLFGIATLRANVVSVRVAVPLIIGGTLVVVMASAMFATPEHVVEQLDIFGLFLLAATSILGAAWAASGYFLIAGQLPRPTPAAPEQPQAA